MGTENILPEAAGLAAKKAAEQRLRDVIDDAVNRLYMLEAAMLKELALRDWNEEPF